MKVPGNLDPRPHVAIACGGTGGHLYPGLAVAEALFERGADVTLVVSSKEVDQQALRGENRFRLLTLPAVGFAWTRVWRFARQTVASYRLARRAFLSEPPAVVLAMGGFTSAPPVLAARALGAVVLLHEANAVPGRANRWLASRAARGYVNFPEARPRWRVRDVQVLGMPVRPGFDDLDAGACRVALGLDPARPVLLTVGGSQGARALNDALTGALSDLRARLPELQFIHLTGPSDWPRVRAAYETAGARAVVKPFLTEMDLAVGAATAAVARAGASSAAEFAALRVPALLIPYPQAADDHQVANARALEATRAARVLVQAALTPERLIAEVVPLIAEPSVRDAMRRALADWHRPDAAQRLADDVLGLAATVASPAGRAAGREGSGLPRIA